MTEQEPLKLTHTFPICSAACFFSFGPICLMKLKRDKEGLDLFPK